MSIDIKMLDCLKTKGLSSTKGVHKSRRTKIFFNFR